MGLQTVDPKKRACTACHEAKVKCVRLNGSSICERCNRLGIKCVDHVSRQGQGTRRRKKVKTTVMSTKKTVDEALLITESVNGTMPVKSLFDPKPSSVMSVSTQPNSSSKRDGQAALCNGMATLEVEDSLISKTLSNGVGRDHYGLNYLIREWVALAFSRRSFNLLARASFIAVKVNISMDDIISNQTPFASATDSQPMDFLARDMLLPKNQRTTIGYPISLQEIPWDIFDAVQIDQTRPNESVRNRWIGIRWVCQGICRFWVSPLFARDFANLEEITKVWVANSPDKEVVDLFLPKSEKGRFGTEIFNLLFVNYRPGMGCFVVKNPYKVNKRNVPEPIDADVIQTMKLVDLDSMFHYFEIQFKDRNMEYLHGENTRNMNKRDHADLHVDNVNDDPLMEDSIEFTDIAMTDEMEEFLKLLSGGDSQNESEFIS